MAAGMFDAYANAMDGFSVEGGATSTTIRDDVAVDNGLATGEFDLYVASDSVACVVQPRPNGQVLIGSSRQYGTTDPAVEPGMLSRMNRTDRVTSSTASGMVYFGWLPWTTANTV